MRLQRRCERVLRYAIVPRTLCIDPVDVGVDVGASVQYFLCRTIPNLFHLDNATASAPSPHGYGPRRGCR